MTSELALVDGPTGTGKTFLGLAAMRALITNVVRRGGAHKQAPPLLVICYSNRGMDQVLEHVLTYESAVVRVGSRSSVLSSPALAQCKLSELVGAEEGKMEIRAAWRMDDDTGGFAAPASIEFDERQRTYGLDRLEIRECELRYARLKAHMQSQLCAKKNPKYSWQPGAVRRCLSVLVNTATSWRLMLRPSWVTQAVLLNLTKTLLPASRGTHSIPQISTTLK